MKNLIIIRGLPGSGKTYLSNGLYGMYLSTDIIVSAPGGTFGEMVYLWHPDMIRESHHVNKIKCKRAMELGIEDIIVDNTNTTWKEILPYVELAKAFGYDVEIMEPDTAWKFDVSECFKRNKHGVPLESIQRMFDRWESTERIKEKLNEYLVY